MLKSDWDILHWVGSFRLTLTSMPESYLELPLVLYTWNTLEGKPRDE